MFDIKTNVKFWSLSLDASTVDGKIVYKKFDGCRGYIGPTYNPTHGEVLQNERNPTDPSKAVLQAIAVLDEDDVIPPDTYILNDHSYQSYKIKPEYETLHEALKQRNEEKSRLLEIANTQFESLVSKFVQDASFVYDVNHTAVIDSVAEIKKPFVYENVPSEWYKRERKVVLLYPWNSSEAVLIRATAKQITAL